MKFLVLISSFLILGNVFSQTFSDVASSNGINFTVNSAINFGQGMSFIDFDEDGWDDLTFPSNVDSIFFYKNNNGSFIKLTSLYAPGDVRQITWLDFDNDGDLDLFCSFHNIGVRLFEKIGNSNFQDITNQSGIGLDEFDAFGVCVADPDADGDLDIYVCSYSTTSSPNPSRNLYFENQGEGFFIEKAIDYGIDNGLQSSFQGVWFDANNDNKLDLHVINDRHPFNDEMYIQNGNNLYTPSANSMSIENSGHFPMSLSISDFNNDGFQDVFKSDAANGNEYNSMVQDYKLYQNNGGSSFTDVASQMNINYQTFAWGGLWIDYNNDSYEDLFISTGFTDTIINTAVSSLLYKNINGTNFENVTDSIQANIIGTSHSGVKGDINKDGFYDLVVVNDGVTSNVLLNSGGENNYVRLTIVGVESNRLAIGSTIKVYANNTCQTQMIFCGSGLCAQNSQHKIFGIGNAGIVDSVVVLFPNGNLVKRYELNANSEYTIFEKTIMPVEIASLNENNNYCLGDSVTIGIPNMHNYQWNTGDSSDFITITSSGNYFFSASNSIGDTIYESNDLAINFIDGIQHQVVRNNTECGEFNMGSIEVIPFNEPTIDSIIWSNDENSFYLSGLADGNYQYTLFSNYGCTESSIVSIQTPPSFSTEFFTLPDDGSGNGSVELFHWGGSPPFNYNLNGSSTSNVINNLPYGTYEVTVEDSLGCADTINFQIQLNDEASIKQLMFLEPTIGLSNQDLTICKPDDFHKLRFQVYDMLGQMIANEVSFSNNSCETFDIPISSGCYLLVTQIDNHIFKQKITVP